MDIVRLVEKSFPEIPEHTLQQSSHELIAEPEKEPNIEALVRFSALMKKLCDSPFLADARLLNVRSCLVQKKGTPTELGKRIALISKERLEKQNREGPAFVDGALGLDVAGQINFVLACGNEQARTSHFYSLGRGIFRERRGDCRHLKQKNKNSAIEIQLREPETPSIATDIEREREREIDREREMDASC